MRDMVKHAATEDLHELVDTLLSAEQMSEQQSNLLYEVVDELIKRGEVTKVTEEDRQTTYEGILRKINEKSDSPISACQEGPDWTAKLYADAEQDRAYTPSRFRSLIKYAAIAAVIMIGVFMAGAIAQAAGLDFFGTLGKWGKNAVEFITGRTWEHDEEFSDAIQLIGVSAKLRDMDIEVDLMTWLPEGTEFVKFERESIESPKALCSWFVRENSYYSLFITEYYADNSLKNEVNSEKAPVVINKREYLIVENLDRIQAYWLDGKYELLLQGNLTRSQIEKILKSIK